MVDLRSALAFAKQYRTCPPVSMFKDPSWEMFINKHIAICPYCSTEIIERVAPLANLVKSWKTDLASSVPPDQEIRPGQIRFIRSDRACWRKGLFYNPPGLLVLEKSPGIKDGYRVAQIYHDVTLAGSGDLVLEDDQTGAGDLIVECWNTYSMKGSHLGPVVGKVADVVSSVVTRMEDDPEAVPAWAAKPLPMEEQDARIYFRELEVEVGYVFASRAVSEIMQEIEKAYPVLLYGTAEKMKAEVEREFPGVVLPETFATLEEALVSARLPFESYAMAAADDESEVEPANFVLVVDGIVKAIRPIQVEVLERNLTAVGLIIGGRIIEMPRDHGERRLLAFLAREGRTVVPAADIKWDESTGHFALTFKLEDHKHRRLKIAVFCYVDAD